MNRLVIFCVIVLSALSALAEDLALEKLFDGRYNNNPHTQVTIITNDYSYFRSIDVNGDSRIVREIEALLKKDKAKSFNCVEEYSNGKYSQILSFPGNVSVGFDKTSDKSANLFISKQAKSGRSGKSGARSTSKSISKSISKSKSSSSKKKERTVSRTITRTNNDSDDRVHVYTLDDGSEITIVSN